MLNSCSPTCIIKLLVLTDLIQCDCIVKHTFSYEISMDISKHIYTCTLMKRKAQKEPMSRDISANGDGDVYNKFNEIELHFTILTHYAKECFSWGVNYMRKFILE